MNELRKITGGRLKVGERYLHNNGLFVRQIDSIQGDTVFWHDHVSTGQCSKKVFLRQCPSVAPETVPLKLGTTDPLPTVDVSTPRQFTIRDEANTLAAFAFRNGFLEDLHAGKPLPTAQQSGFSRISDAEMRRLMVEASEKLASLLRMKEENPEKYAAFLREYNKIYCRSWLRD